MYQQKHLPVFKTYIQFVLERTGKPRVGKSQLSFLHFSHYLSALLRRTDFHNNTKSKEEGKYQELIQSSITPDQSHHMGKVQKNKEKSHTREVSPFSPGDDKAVRNRQAEDSITKSNGT